MELFSFIEREMCEQALLEDLTSQMQDHLNEHTSLSIALAGGNTPKQFYSRLSESPLAWENIKVTLTDERWVDTNDADSNQRMILETLLTNQAKSASFYGLKNPEVDVDKGQVITADLLNDAIPKLDFVVLGMGDDGHFASIFPNMDNTSALLDMNQAEPCMAAHPAGKPDRLSLTLSYLLKAKRIYLFICGEKKRAVLEAMHAEKPDEYLPIYFLLHQSTCPVNVYWSET